MASGRMPSASVVASRPAAAAAAAELPAGERRRNTFIGGVPTKRAAKTVAGRS